MVTRLLLLAALLFGARAADAAMFYQLSADRIVNTDEICYAHTVAGTTTLYFSNGVAAVLSAEEKTKLVAWLALKNGNPAPGILAPINGYWIVIPKILQIRKTGGNAYLVEFSPTVSVSLTGAQVLTLTTEMTGQIYNGPQ